MEYPEPNIEVEAAAAELFAAAKQTFGQRSVARTRLRSLFAQAWEEGRWSPPGPCANPYGRPGASPRCADTEGFPGLRMLRLREATQAALAWIENMAPTVRRTVLAEQLRSALGGKRAPVEVPDSVEEACPCWCSEYQSSGLPCLPGKCPNAPKVAATQPAPESLPLPPPPKRTP